MDKKHSNSAFLKRTLTPSRPFIFLFLCYLTGIILFAGYRMLFILTFHEQIFSESIRDILIPFFIGWRFDQVVVFAILLPLLLILPFVGLRSKLARISSLIYLTVIFSGSIILLLSDIRFFKYFNTHLNFQSLQYVTEGGATTGHLIRSEPMFIPFILIWLVITVLLIFYWKYLLRITKRFPERYTWSGQGFFFIICLALTFLGIRGRINIAPIDWGVAYFSENHYLNQSALNGIYTLGKALTEEGRDPRLVYLSEKERFPFVDFKDGLDSVKAMLQSPQDEWLEPDKSLLRLTKQPDAGYGFQPNIVLVLLESWPARNTGILGCPHNLTPHFDKLAQNGILFTDFYASGTRTNYGLTAVFCSFPSIPGRAIITRYNTNHPFITLPEILHDRGYFNTFVYGGDLVFDNIEGFFTTKKVDRFYGEKELGEDLVFAKWGIPDHIVFEKTREIIDSLPRPFMVSVLTLSNHEPYDLPDSSVQLFKDNSDSAKIYNVQLYADLALGKFMDSIQQDPVFDSTIFIFTADHARYGYGRLWIEPVDFRVPLLIYSPSLFKQTDITISRIGGQPDILPTVMGLLGGNFTHFSWGRNLLDSSLHDGGFATMNVLNHVGIIENNCEYEEEIGRTNGLYHLTDHMPIYEDISKTEPDSYRELQRRLRTYIQIAEQLCTPSIK